ncbi:MAG: hypothetical protein ACR2LR_08285 [Hassallia sp.]|jgi:hypothetical protein
MLQRFLDWTNEVSNSITYLTSLEREKVREDLGFISDNEKIVILKQQLYCAAKANQSTTNLHRAIDCLQQGLDAEMREKNSFNSQLSGITNSLILIAIIATGLSYAVTKNCGNSSSHLCRDARIIPDAVSNYIK